MINPASLFLAVLAVGTAPIGVQTALASLLAPDAMVLAQAAAPQTGPAHEFTEEEVAEAAKAVVAEHSKGGVFLFRDPKTDTALSLVFDEVKLVRGIRGDGWFPNVILHDKEVPQKKYAVDLWLLPQGDRLLLVDARIQKAPRQDGAAWMMVTREPIAWWWLPTLQRASTIGVNRPWNIMAAVHKHIAAARQNGIYEFKDDAGVRKLELVDVELPVMRRRSDGRFVVCAGFRNTGANREFFDIDFEFDSKSGVVAAQSGRARANPMQAGDEASQTHCDFKHLDAEVVQ